MAEFELNGVKLDVPDAMLSERLTEKLSTGGYEANEARAAMSRVSKGQRVLDLGSGVGYIAAICAAITGAENVVTVEANPDMLPVIRKNLEGNGFAQVQLIHGAITGVKDGPDSILFERKKTFWAGRIAEIDADPKAVVDVPLLSLSDLLNEVRPHVVIMDIEGAEAGLFEAPWPDFVYSVMLELHPGRYRDTVIKRIVDCMSQSDMTYDPQVSRGRVIGFRRLRQK